MMLNPKLISYTIPQKESHKNPIRDYQGRVAEYGSTTFLPSHLAEKGSVSF